MKRNYLPETKIFLFLYTLHRGENQREILCKSNSKPVAQVEFLKVLTKRFGNGMHIKNKAKSNKRLVLFIGCFKRNVIYFQYLSSCFFRKAQYLSSFTKLSTVTRGQ